MSITRSPEIEAALVELLGKEPNLRSASDVARELYILGANLFVATNDFFDLKKSQHVKDNTALTKNIAAMIQYHILNSSDDSQRMSIINFWTNVLRESSVKHKNIMFGMAITDALNQLIPIMDDATNKTYNEVLMEFLDFSHKANKSLLTCHEPDVACVLPLIYEKLEDLFKDPVSNIGTFESTVKDYNCLFKLKDEEFDLLFRYIDETDEKEKDKILDQLIDIFFQKKIDISHIEFANAEKRQKLQSFDKAQYQESLKGFLKFSLLESLRNVRRDFVLLNMIERFGKENLKHKLGYESASEFNNNIADALKKLNIKIHDAIKDEYTLSALIKKYGDETLKQKIGLDYASQYEKDVVGFLSKLEIKVNDVIKEEYSYESLIKQYGSNHLKSVLGETYPVTFKLPDSLIKLGLEAELSGGKLTKYTKADLQGVIDMYMSVKIPGEQKKIDLRKSPIANTQAKVSEGLPPSTLDAVRKLKTAPANLDQIQADMATKFGALQMEAPSLKEHYKNKMPAINKSYDKLQAAIIKLAKFVKKHEKYKDSMNPKKKIKYEMSKQILDIMTGQYELGENGIYMLNSKIDKICTAESCPDKNLGKILFDKKAGVFSVLQEHKSTVNTLEKFIPKNFRTDALSKIKTELEARPSHAKLEATVTSTDAANKKSVKSKTATESSQVQSSHDARSSEKSRSEVSSKKESVSSSRSKIIKSPPLVVSKHSPSLEASVSPQPTVTSGASPKAKESDTVMEMISTLSDLNLKLVALHDVLKDVNRNLTKFQTLTKIGIFSRAGNTETLQREQHEDKRETKKSSVSSVSETGEGTVSPQSLNPLSRQ